MKRFRFQLDALLRVRRLEEDRRLSQFRQKQKALLDTGHEVNRVADEHQEQLENLRSLEQGEIDLSEVLARRRYLIHLHQKGVELNQELERRGRDVATAKTFLDEAMRERKVVERLRERRYQEYLLAFRREESRELDEIGQGRHRVSAGEAGGS